MQLHGSHLELVNFLIAKQCSPIIIETIKRLECDEYILLNNKEETLIKELNIPILQLAPLLKLLKEKSNSLAGADNNTVSFATLYDVISVLGKGAYSTVYKVNPKGNPNIVRAVKMIREREDFGVNEALKEVMNIQKLSHENVVKIYKAIVTDQRLLLIEMECFPLGSLQDHFIDKQIIPTTKQIVSILQQMVEVLKYMYEKHNMVHRDVKPANILISNIENESIKVCLADFGLSKLIGNSSRVSSLCGTEGFVAQEIIKWNDESSSSISQPFSIASDLYALGASIFYLMTNTKFNGSNLYLLKSSPFPDSLKDIVCNMLSEEPACRALEKIESALSLALIQINSLQEALLTEMDAVNLFAMGCLFHEGINGQQSYEKAFKLFEQSATQGCPDAQHMLGKMYSDGNGCQQSHEEAFKWYSKGAAQNCVNAQFNLALLYRQGQGCEQSEERAFEWFEKAAKQGCKEAQFAIGKIIAGKGENSYHEAFEWFEKSARQGYVDSQFYLGIMYKNGEGCQKSDEKAFKWFKKAAVKGCSNSQFELGLLFISQGNGSKASIQKAKEWFGKSAIQGNEEAKMKVLLLSLVKNSDNSDSDSDSDEEIIRNKRNNNVIQWDERETKKRENK